jgi:hypothetical protein
MFNFFKKNKITFLCYQEPFINSWPPIYSKDLPRPFLKECHKEYQNNQLKDEKNPSCPFKKHRNTARCDGIRDMISLGYIIRLHRDIRITTNGDGESYQWEVLRSEGEQYTEDVSGFARHQFADFIKIPENALKTVLKINTPWLIDSSDHCFIQTHPSYFGEHRFTVLEGVIDTKKTREINIIMFWHILDGTEILRAGTPIAQLIPIQRKFLPTLEVKIDDKNLRKRITNLSIAKNSTNTNSFRPSFINL